MSEDNFIKVPKRTDNVKDHSINVRVSESLFKQVYAVSVHTETNMSEVVRMCIEAALPKVEKALRAIAELKKMR